MDWESPTAAELVRAQEERTTHSPVHETPSVSWSPGEIRDASGRRMFSDDD